MIVVDTNLIAYLFIEGPCTPLAQKAFRKISYPVIPSFWKTEFLNILATYVRTRRMTLSQVEAIWETAHELPLIEESPSEKQVLRLAAQTGCSAYDCMFAALAQEQGLLLVTFDRKILNKFPRIAISPHQMVEIT